MSRDLKFRAWVIDKNCYMEVVSIEFLTNKVILKGNWNKANNEPTMKAVPLDKVILEQDTGLKDKNGKKICEGDIVKVARSYGYGFLPKGAKAKIEFDEKELCYKLRGHGEFRLTAKKELEVIGNIHENPELLEGEK